MNGNSPEVGSRRESRVRTRPLVRTGLLGVLVAVIGWSAAAAAGMPFSEWSTAQKIDEIGGNSQLLNTSFADGCPIQSPDGLSLYIASNRDGYVGTTRNLDIWVAHRESTDAPWGAPENLGAPVNSPVDDFCPTPVRGGGLFFVSREEPASCGTNDSDIYFTRFNPVQGWSEPVHLGCGPAGPNSALDEMGPSYIELDERGFLYFSSGPDIYVSERLPDGSFGPAAPVSELNSAAADIQPNVRKDGLEILFASNRRAGTDQDLYVATRASVEDPFSAPLRLGDSVNTVTASETRPSLTWDGATLLFGRAPGPEGLSDIFTSTRDKVHGSM
jgi:hypothetical protein